MAEHKFSYTYTNVNGVNFNITLSASKAAVGGFTGGSSSQGNFPRISRRNYPWSVYGVGGTTGSRVRIPCASYSAWQALITAGNFTYTNEFGVTDTYTITSHEGEKIINTAYPA